MKINTTRIVITLSLLFFLINNVYSSEVFVDNSGGVILRKRPSIRGKKICVTPDNTKIIFLSFSSKKYKYRITIKENDILKKITTYWVGYTRPYMSKKIQPIDNITAHWAKVKYKNKTGWVFGGFIRFKNSKEITNQLWNGKWKLKYKQKSYGKRTYVIFKLKINKYNDNIFSPCDPLTGKEYFYSIYEYNDKVKSYRESVASLSRTHIVDLEQHIIEFVSDKLIRSTELYQDEKKNYIRMNLYKKIE
ncbi:MAG: hypothetical protein GY754_16485 [bacterium]|nr:hypothetical protein [bacterium]